MVTGVLVLADGCVGLTDAVWGRTGTLVADRPLHANLRKLGIGAPRRRSHEERLIDVFPAIG